MLFSQQWLSSVIEALAGGQGLEDNRRHAAVILHMKMGLFLLVITSYALNDFVVALNMRPLLRQGFLLPLDSLFFQAPHSP